MQWVVDHWEVLVLIAMNFLGLAGAIVKLTPSTTDDEWIAKIEAVVRSVADEKKPQ